MRLGIGQRVQVRHRVVERPHPVLLEAEIPEAQRIQYRGDAGGGALRVMRDHRRARGPARVAARLHLAFQIVGVHVHHAGNQIVAIEIDRARAGCATHNIADHRAIDRHGAEDHLVTEHQAGIGQYGHAASCNGATSNSRSATASRTSVS